MSAEITTCGRRCTAEQFSRTKLGQAFLASQPVVPENKLLVGGLSRTLWTDGAARSTIHLRLSPHVGTEGGT
jgi:hypothetical protein